MKFSSEAKEITIELVDTIPQDSLDRIKNAYPDATIKFVQETRDSSNPFFSSYKDGEKNEVFHIKKSDQKDKLAVSGHKRKI